MRRFYNKNVKYYAMILSLGVILGLSACGKKDDEEDFEDFEIEEMFDDEDFSDEDFSDEDFGDYEIVEDDSDDSDEEEFDEDFDEEEYGNIPDKEKITINETMEKTGDGEHVITADNQSADYSNVKIIKSGNSEGDEADFYGDNAAVFATNGGTLGLSSIVMETNGKHANGVFSYGEGTTVNVSDSVIETSGDCSGGLMTTGGGTMNATNMNIHTTGRSSAAIRSDRGGGKVNVTGGSYVTDGTGSPVIYSTADIRVSEAIMKSTASQGVVVEGKNSVTLEDVDMVADNNTKNSDKSDYYQAVMIYQSMSGDAQQGSAAFTMSESFLTNKKGDVFFVNNTNAVISLVDCGIINEDNDGLFLRAAAAGWGKEGANGANVFLKTGDQLIEGDILVDDISTMNMYLASESELIGAINSDGKAGDIYVEITGESKWTLTADSYITSLTCDKSSIVLDGHKLFVNGEEYKEGTESTGKAVEEKEIGGGDMQAPPDDKGGPDGGNPPEKPDGEDKKPGEEPPEKPD